MKSSDTAAKTGLKIRCRNCSAALRIGSGLIDKKIRCPKCGERFAVRDAVRDDSARGDGPPSSPPSAARNKADPLLGARIRHFKILRVLGRGAMGTVYEAEDVMLQRRVAIKVLLPRVAAEGQVALERFLSEARSAARLQHPNIVYIHQVGNDKDRAFIAMELVSGGSAADFLEEHGPMLARDATRVIIECAKALGEAHSKGIVHRDVKPDNIMLGPKWMVKVTDFGLAKRLDYEEDAGIKGKALGTPGYMSPETCRGSETDARSDIYSLGATYFCLLTGKPPFHGPDVRQILRRHIAEAPPDCRTLRPDVPAACTAVIRKAMALEPGNRYESADDMIADLQAIDFSEIPTFVDDGDSMESWTELAAAAQVDLAVDADGVPFAKPDDEPEEPADALPDFKRITTTIQAGLRSSGAIPRPTTSTQRATTRAMSVVQAPHGSSRQTVGLRPAVRPAAKPFPWVAVLIAAAVLLLGGAALAWRLSGPSAPPPDPVPTPSKKKDADKPKSGDADLFNPAPPPGTSMAPATGMAGPGMTGMTGPGTTGTGMTGTGMTGTGSTGSPSGPGATTEPMTAPGGTASPGGTNMPGATMPTVDPVGAEFGALLTRVGEAGANPAALKAVLADLEAFAARNKASGNPNHQEFARQAEAEIARLRRAKK